MEEHPSMTQPDTIDGIYAQLGDWTPVVAMQERLRTYFHTRSRDEIPDYREKRGAQKRLRDEVVPVFRFFEKIGFTGDVRFGFNSDAPDCWFRNGDDAEATGLEVTAALAREAQLRGRALNQQGQSAGFIGILDKTPQAEVDRLIARPRRMYTTEHALRTTEMAIRQCLRKKDKPKYEGFHLLVEAPLNSIPEERWSGVFANLEKEAASLPFEQVHLIGDRDGNLITRRLK
jgi:hypothetical protein